jgi:hypothetical protein
LLLSTVVVTIVFASLKHPLPIVGDLFYTIGVMTILVGTLAAILVHGRNKAYWIGFVVLFAGYFCHTVWPSPLRSASSILWKMGSDDSESRELITEAAISYLFDVMHPSPGKGSQGRAMRPEDYSSFLAVGHTAIALLLGICGGTIAQRLACQ